MNGLRLYRTVLHEDALCDCDDGRVAATVGSTVPDVDVYGVVSNITDIDGNPTAVPFARVRTVHKVARENAIRNEQRWLGLERTGFAWSRNGKNMRFSADLFDALPDGEILYVLDGVTAL
jgi:hypothetical protein